MECVVDIVASDIDAIIIACHSSQVSKIQNPRKKVCLKISDLELYKRTLVLLNHQSEAGNEIYISVKPTEAAIAPL